MESMEVHVRSTWTWRVTLQVTLLYIFLYNNENGIVIIMFNTILRFVNNPYFVTKVIELSYYFETEVAEEFEYELIDDIEVTYNFYVN